MNKKSFYEILVSSTPEELNEMISLHGTTKLVNAITFIHPEDDESNKEKENKNI